MPRLPTSFDLGVVDPQVSNGVASYNPTTGFEMDVAKSMSGAASAFGDAAGIFYRAEEQQRHADAQDAEIKYHQKLIEQEKDPTIGWEMKKGGDANEAFAKEQIGLSAKYKTEIADTITDERTKELFLRRAAPVELTARSRILEHTAKQTFSHRIEGFKSLQEQYIKQIAESSNDALAGASMNMLVASRIEMARLSGVSKEGLVQAASDAYSEGMTARINNALYMKNDTAEAQRLFQLAKAGSTVPDPSGATDSKGNPVVIKYSLSQEAQKTFGKELNHRIDLDKQMGIANDYVDKMGPKKSDEPFLIDDMMGKVRQEYPNESASFYDGVRNNFIKRKADWEADSSQRDGKAMGQLELLIASNASVDSIKRNPMYSTLTPAHQASILRAAESHLYALTVRHSAEESRAHARRVREEEDLTYNSQIQVANMYDDIPLLRSKTVEQIQAMAPSIGRQNTMILLKRRRELDVPVKYSADNDQINGLLNDAGIPKPHDEKTRKQDEGRYLKARVAIEDALNAEANLKHRPLSNEEAGAVIRGVIDKKVMLEKPWYSANKEVMAATVLPEEMKQVRAIPLKQIPANVAMRYVGMIRDKHGIGLEVSNEEILKSYGESIGKAYQVYKVGGNEDAVMWHLNNGKLAPRTTAPATSQLGILGTTK